jgi:methyl-accepting chemotaxis protein
VNERFGKLGQIPEGQFHEEKPMKKRNGKSGAKATSIYERIGGEAAVRSAVEGLYKRILGDVVLSPFFAGVDTKRTKEQQVMFFSQALGGPARYQGPALRALHAEMKIEQRHFDRTVHHLVACLKELHVDDALADEVVEAIRPLRQDVVTVETGEDSMAADNREALIFKQLIENSPINVMRADNDMVIRYINAALRKTLEKVAHLLPCPVDNVVGSSIDIFHKNPTHQRRILSDPKNLPHRACIQLGPETLSLVINPLYDAEKKCVGTMVTLDIITEEVRLQALADDYAAQMTAIGRSRGCLTLDLDGTIMGANAVFESFVGYSDAELKGKHHSVLVEERLRSDSEYRQFWETLRRGQHVSGDFKIIGKGGKEVWLAAIYNPILDAKGALYKVVCFASNVTEQKLKNADYAGQLAAIDKSRAVIEFHMDGTIIKANDSLLKTMGYTLEELVGKHHGMFVGEPYRNSREYQEFWAKLNRGEYISGDYKRFGKGGKEVWLAATYNPILDMNGKPFKVVKFATDITEQKVKTADYQGQIEAIHKSQAVIEFNMDGTVITANSIFLSTMGYALDEIRGKHHSLFVDDAHRRSPEYTEFWAKLNRGENVAMEFKRIAKGGKEVWLQASYNPIMDLNGKPFKVVKYASDVTEAVKSREAIEEAAERDHLAAEEMKRKVDSILGVVAAATKGDLTHDITVGGSDGVGQMGEGLATFFSDLRRSIASIGETAKNLAHASEEVTTQGQQMSANSEETSAQANVVAKATQQVNENLQSVATGAEEMTLTVRSIASNASEAARVAGEAVKTAQAANDTVSKLGESSAEIGQVIKVITSIAQQTNLLALNATIEAARAGEAGKGFAVVANEVKELAKQTAKATEEISQKITTIQHDTKGAVEAIGTIGETINKINEISTTIATAVEEQSATTNEMSRNVAEAAKGSGEISQNIQGVAQAANGTAASAQGSQKSALQLAEMAAQLRSLVERFKIERGESGQARAASAAR